MDIDYKVVRELVNQAHTHLSSLEIVSCAFDQATLRDGAVKEMMGIRSRSGVSTRSLRKTASRMLKALDASQREWDSPGPPSPGLHTMTIRVRPDVKVA